jgi:MFS transporter, DHA3 family, macrolide efflux protein
VQSAFAIGAVIGGLIVSAWGGFKKCVRGMMIGWATFAFFGLFLFGLGCSLCFWIPFAIIVS